MIITIIIRHCTRGYYFNFLRLDNKYSLEEFHPFRRFSFSRNNRIILKIFQFSISTLLAELLFPESEYRFGENDGVSGKSKNASTKSASRFLFPARPLLRARRSKNGRSRVHGEKGGNVAVVAGDTTHFRLPSGHPPATRCVPPFKLPFFPLAFLSLFHHRVKNHFFQAFANGLRGGWGKFNGPSRE